MVLARSRPGVCGGDGGGWMGPVGPRWRFSIPSPPPGTSAPGPHAPAADALALLMPLQLLPLTYLALLPLLRRARGDGSSVWSPSSNSESSVAV